MKERTIEVRNLLFSMHLLMYGFLGVITLGNSNSYSSNPFGAIFVLWSVLFFLHMRSYFLDRGRTNGIRDERTAYRDGFNDAVRMTREGQDVPDRLMIDNDGELVEESKPEKRKYR